MALDFAIWPCMHRLRLLHQCGWCSKVTEFVVQKRRRVEYDKTHMNFYSSSVELGVEVFIANGSRHRQVSWTWAILRHRMDNSLQKHHMWWSLIAEKNACKPFGSWGPDYFQTRPIQNINDENVCWSQINFIGQLNSKDFYKRPSVMVCKSVACAFLSWFPFASECFSLRAIRCLGNRYACYMNVLVTNILLRLPPKLVSIACWAPPNISLCAIAATTCRKRLVLLNSLY